MAKRGPGWTKGRPRDESTKVKISETMTGIVRSEETRERMSKPKSEETKRRMREAHKLRDKVAIRAKSDKTKSERQTGRHRVSKPELALVPRMQLLGFEHTGAGGFYITGRDRKIRCPDFVNRAERKVFELWGDYWHRGQDPEELVKWYAEVGWSAQVVWLSQLEGAFDV